MSWELCMQEEENTILFAFFSFVNSLHAVHQLNTGMITPASPFFKLIFFVFSFLSLRRSGWSVMKFYVRDPSKK
jgi:hypothetical protein